MSDRKKKAGGKGKASKAAQDPLKVIKLTFCQVLFPVMCSVIFTGQGSRIAEARRITNQN